MAGVDFDQVRGMFTIDQVLQKVNWLPTRRRGAQLRGPCPVCRGEGRCLSVNVATDRYFCHKCGSRGNVLELWMALTDLSVYQAAIDLCRTFNRTVPTVKRW